MRKILFTILFILPIWVSASTKIDGIFYNFDTKTKTASVTSVSYLPGYYEGNIAVPETIKYNGDSYTVTSIEGRAFRTCNLLISVIIANSVTEIGDEAFCSCRNLKSVTLGSSVRQLGQGVFDWSNQLAILVDAGNENYCSVDGVLMNKNMTKLVRCPCGIKGIYEIPNTITAISDSAFYLCQDLTEVIIPNSVKVIGRKAFGSCSGLTSAKIGNSVESYEHAAFAGCSSLESVIIPDGATSIGTSMFQDCRALKSIELPESLIQIGSAAFKHCNSLTSVHIPDNVTDIGANAFSSCSSLKSVIIPEGVTVINEETFYGCSNLTSISLGSVNVINDNAFRGCKLKKLTIPNSVKSIRDQAFAECTSLDTVIIGSSVEVIGRSAFYTVCCSDLYFRGRTPPTSTLSTGIFAKVVHVPTGTRNNYAISSDLIPRYKYIWEDGDPNVSKVKIEDLWYYVDTESMTAVVTNKNGGEKDSEIQNLWMGEVAIPSTITYNEQDFLVIGIGEYALAGGYFTKLILPASIKTIGTGALWEAQVYDMYCLSTIPPICFPCAIHCWNDLSHHQITVLSCILHVLPGLKSVYEKADTWCEIWQIIEDADSNGQTTENISTITKSDKIKVYGIDGISHSNYKQGISIVKMNDRTVKKIICK